MSGNLELPALPACLEAVRVDPSRHRVVNGPRQMGKDYLGCAVAFDWAWRGGRVWWLSQVFDNSDASYKLAKSLLVGVDVVRVRESDRELRFPSGGTLTFRTTDGGSSIDNLRGATLDGLVANEWAFSDPEGEVWDTVSASLAVKRAPVLFLSTPDGVGNAWHRMVQRGDPAHPTYDSEWKSWCFSSRDSLFISRDELEKRKRSMPELRFRQEYNGEFLSGAGARIARAWLKVGEPPAGLSIAMGVDLAASLRGDWTACAVLGRDSKGIVYVLAVERVRASFADVLAFIQRMAAQWHPSVIGVEDFGYQKVATQELLRTSSLNVKPVRMEGDKVAKFSPLEARYQQGQVIHAPTLRAEFIDELLAFGAGCEHDDQVDAMSIAWEMLKGNAWTDKFKRAMGHIQAGHDPYKGIAFLQSLGRWPPSQGGGDW